MVLKRLSSQNPGDLDPQDFLQRRRRVVERIPRMPTLAGKWTIDDEYRLRRDWKRRYRRTTNTIIKISNFRCTGIVSLLLWNRIRTLAKYVQPNEKMEQEKPKNVWDYDSRLHFTIISPFHLALKSFTVDYLGSPNHLHQNPQNGAVNSVTV